MKFENHLELTGPHVYSANLKYRKYCWVRIPKCGSSTIMSVLGQNIRPTYHNFSASHTGWEEYFKFAFVRNPWARLYSCYMHKVKKGCPACSNYLHSFAKTNISFINWVKTICTQENVLKDRHFAPYHTLLINKDFESMDFIGKVENFQKDFNFVCDKLIVPRYRLPRKNKTDGGHYSENYDDETRKIVEEIYAKDIEYFGYKFDS